MIKDKIIYNADSRISIKILRFENHSRKQKFLLLEH